MTYKYPLASSSWNELELNSLKDVISADKFTMGEKVKIFEDNFASYFGSRYAVMVNSGSSANLIMVAALRYIQDSKFKLSPGDEIIVPAISWSTTYYPLHQYGLHLKFVDVNPLTLNYDLVALSDAVSDKTRAIMAVNLLGNSNDFDEIKRITTNRHIILIEDNCESLGATFKGKLTGTFGVMGSFSFYYSHHISTMEGGMVLTDNEELYHLMLSIRSHGWTRDIREKNTLLDLSERDPFTNSFNFILPGYNLRPLEMSGAIGIEQLKKLPSIIKERRKNGALFQSKMAEHPKFIIQQEIGESSWFGFSLILRKEFENQREFVANQLKKLGFECRPIVAGNFVKNKVVDYFDYEVHGELKNADYIDKNGLFIGNHHYPITEALDELANF
jgi:CDP-6-deoxy-D-xylo-4-hexulose-3-dehydrase